MRFSPFLCFLVFYHVLYNFTPMAHKRRTKNIVLKSFIDFRIAYNKRQFTEGEGSPYPLNEFLTFFLHLHSIFMYILFAKWENRKLPLCACACTLNKFVCHYSSCIYCMCAFVVLWKNATVEKSLIYARGCARGFSLLSMLPYGVRPLIGFPVSGPGVYTDPVTVSLPAFRKQTVPWSAPICPALSWFAARKLRRRFFSISRAAPFLHKYGKRRNRIMRVNFLFSI